MENLSKNDIMYYNSIPIYKLEELNPNWFSVGNKRFFNSKWENYAIQNQNSIHAYFISSEKHEPLFSKNYEPRKYTIKNLT